MSSAIPSKLLVVVVVVANVTACSETKSPITPEPSPRPPSVASVAVTGPEAVFTGRSVTYTATVTLSDGTPPSGPVFWTSSNPVVATVNPSGQLESRSHGSTTLTATYAGRSDSKVVQVVNNYRGIWEGRYVIRSCSDTGDLAQAEGGWCLADEGRVGRTGGLFLLLAHHPENLNQVSATNPSYKGELAGVVGADGRLTLSGSLTWWGYDGWAPESTLEFGPWDTVLDETGMTGRFSLRYTSHVPPRGTALMANELVTMTRR